MVTTASFYREIQMTLGQRGMSERYEGGRLTPVTFFGRLQMHTLLCLLPTITLDVSRARLARRATVRALRYRPTFLLDVHKFSV